MERPILSPAKVVLLAVQLASKSDIARFQTLVSQHPRTLHNELVLRILLSYLPESLESSSYVPFLEALATGNLEENTDITIDASAVENLGDQEARKKVRKLGLLPLAWPNAPEYIPADHMVLFLIHRALRVDEYTGFLTPLPDLIVPFLHLSPYLRTWYISSVLPLIRLNYEYHPEASTVLSIPKFEGLDDRAGVALLLSGTGTKDGSEEENHNIGRDLKGLVGPWMYGDSRWKRRKLRESSFSESQSLRSLDEIPAANNKLVAWDEVFKWIVIQAGSSWKTAVGALEQWDGPGDVDLGGYEDHTMWLDEDEQQHLERRYARAGIATAYLISEESEQALYGVHRVLTRIITLLDKDRIPTLQAAAALLSPVPSLDKNLLVVKNATFLRNDVLQDYNILTSPNDDSMALLHALLISAFLCTRVGFPLSVRQAGELALLQDEAEQKMAFSKLVAKITNGPKGDDKHWIRIRNELLWMHSWGAEELAEGADAKSGRGIFGSLSRSFIETELLKLLLTNTRYTLARSIYEMAAPPPLSADDLHQTIISAAMNAYDNASNANRTRGGVKRCNDILQAFPDTFRSSITVKQMEALLKVTHRMGDYRLVFKQEEFRPVRLRVHADPISLIGKLLEQNARTYAKLPLMLEMGHDIVKAGLTVRKICGKPEKVSEEKLDEEYAIAQKRIVAMCIDAALAEDDFETAYSYIATRLKNIAGPAQSRTPNLERMGSGLTAERPPRIIDDWSWRAALQAGKYRRNHNTVVPTHFGSTSENLDIRHLEQRMDCLAQALRLAPKSTLQEILNVYRRCEEELESLVKQEAELEAQQEAAWDLQGDGPSEDGPTIPGGFSLAPARNAPTNARLNEETPVSLFDLSREGIARAQSGLSALSILRGGERQMAIGTPVRSPSTPEPQSTNKVRKRDQLKNAAVGGLASGVGWLIGAPATKSDSDASP